VIAAAPRDRGPQPQRWAARSSAPPAHGPTRADFKRELLYLFKLHEVLEKRVSEAKAPALVLSGGGSFGARGARHLSEHFERAVVRRRRAATTAFFVLQPHAPPSFANRVELYAGSGSRWLDGLPRHPGDQTMIGRRVDLAKWRLL